MATLFGFFTGAVACLAITVLMFFSDEKVVVTWMDFSFVALLFLASVLFLAVGAYEDKKE